MGAALPRVADSPQRLFPFGDAPVDDSQRSGALRTGVAAMLWFLFAAEEFRRTPDFVTKAALSAAIVRGAVCRGVPYTN